MPVKTYEEVQQMTDEQAHEEMGRLLDLVADYHDARDGKDFSLDNPVIGENADLLLGFGIAIDVAMNKFDRGDYVSIVQDCIKMAFLLGHDSALKTNKIITGVDLAAQIDEIDAEIEKRTTIAGNLVYTDLAGGEVIDEDELDRVQDREIDLT